jgi:hypothetical protein
MESANMRSKSPLENENVAKWFEANPQRKDSVAALIRTLAVYFDSDNHGYINKKSQVHYMFGGSYAESGNAEIIVSVKHSLVRFWLNRNGKGKNTAGEAKTLKSRSGTDLYAIDFKVVSTKDHKLIAQFLKYNKIPGWNQVPKDAQSITSNQATELEEFETKVQKSLGDSRAAREARLGKAEKSQKRSLERWTTIAETLMLLLKRVSWPTAFVVTAVKMVLMW